MRVKWVTIVVTVLVVLAGAGLFALTWRSAYDPVDPPDPASFDPALIERGQQLAGIGGCAMCHTAEGGEAYAGGVAVPTTYGAVHSTNITPDPETGIGRWSEAAFRRAMREGVARDGTHLYPAFPYPHYARASDEDLRALYAYLMTRPAVRAEAPENELDFPFGRRAVMAFWNLAFHDDAAFRPNPSRSAAWNRGAYLAEGLGRCASCHAPANAFGAVRRSQGYAGGEAEGWYGPALDSTSPALMPWTTEAAFNVLRGWDQHHGIAAGPMARVVDGLASAPDEDVAAIATYVASLAGERLARQTTMERAAAFAAAREFGPDAQAGTGPAISADRPTETQEGERIFIESCVSCHHQGDASPGPRPAPLAFSSSITGPDARNFLHIVLHGIVPPAAQAERAMPGFAQSLTDREIAALAGFARSRFANRPNWHNLPATIRAVREAGGN
ncbi:cytochrome c [Faunimonas sp. B44]|uniref:cytochrome c n=1 Tax=Faunimonas sp. B44 TaxID=3461493 RepID=UPI004045018F